MITASVIAATIALTPVALVPVARDIIAPRCRTLRIEDSGKSIAKPLDNRVAARREAADWACVVPIDRQGRAR